jgi:hypothetical protein
MMQKSAAIQSGVPAAKVGQRFGRKRGRPAMADQGGENSEAGNGQRRNGNGGGQGRRRKNRPSANVDQMDEAQNTIKQTNRQRAGGQRSGRNRGRPSMADQGGPNGKARGGQRRNGNGGQRRNGNGGRRGRGGTTTPPLPKEDEEVDF